MLTPESRQRPAGALRQDLCSSWNLFLQTVDRYLSPLSLLFKLLLSDPVGYRQISTFFPTRKCTAEACFPRRPSNPNKPANLIDDPSRLANRNEKPSGKSKKRLPVVDRKKPIDEPANSEKARNKKTAKSTSTRHSNSSPSSSSSRNHGGYLEMAGNQEDRHHGNWHP